MVQRKVVEKLGIQDESSPKKHVSSKKKSTSQNQDVRNRGGGELKKKMMKARSFKASDFENLGSPKRRFKKLSVDSPKLDDPKKKTVPDESPNYMKPTSSWDARKERLQSQVSPHSQTRDGKKSPKNSNLSNPCLATVKFLKITSSLKPVRPSKAKIFEVAAALYPKLNARRATCSSTLKDSKFPAYVQLHPGGAESVMKVCPYTYCSLNGHHHEPFPPLKRFLSTRRRLLKTQKSMKLKGLSSPRMRKHGDRKKGADTGQIMAFDGESTNSVSDSAAASVISPVIEQIGTDFFVEIYAKPGGHNAEAENHSGARKVHDGDDEIPLGSNEISTEKDMEEIGQNHLSESLCKISVGDDLVQNRGLLVDPEFDVPMTLPEDPEFDHLTCMMQSDQVEACSKVYSEGEMIEETETSVGKFIDEVESFSDENNMYLDDEGVPCLDDGIDYSMFSDDGTVSITAPLTWNEDPHELDFGTDDAVKAIEVISEVIIQVDEDAESITTLFGMGDCEGGSVQLYYADEFLENVEVYDASEVTETETPGQYCESIILDEQESDVLSDAHSDIIYNTSFSTSEDVIDEKQNSDDKGKLGYYVSGSSALEECDDSERNIFSSALDHIGDDHNIQLENNLMMSSDLSCVIANFKSLGEDENKHQQETYTRKVVERPTENSDQLRKFNPRAPQFLIPEPDPEAERVDLRHQMIDDRKNAEEWMIDYALQQAVGKLAPAKKRRVELLVQAFETVMPLPNCEAHLRHETENLTHARPIQACS